MKNIRCFVICIAVIAIFSSCTNKNDNRFLIRKSTNSTYLYTIYDEDGTVAYSRVSESLPQICMVSETVLEIKRGVGTGTWIVEYFDLENKVLSNQYECAYFLSNNMVAFFTRGDERDLENITFCMQDPFTLKTEEKACRMNITSANVTDGIKEITCDEKGITIVYYDGKNEYKEAEVEV